MSKDQELDQLAPDGFTMMRNGIREHILGGRFTGYDYGIYSHLHAFAGFRCGICYTNAVAIGNLQDIPATSVKDSLSRMRERGFINYRRGDGHRGSYPIFIMRYVPTDAVLSGYKLTAFNNTDLTQEEGAAEDIEIGHTCDHGKYYHNAEDDFQVADPHSINPACDKCTQAAAV